MTKKEAKGGIAQQFLKDDEARGFSKRKYEGVNERLRRMGEKKRRLRINKDKHRKAGGFKDSSKKK